MEYLTGIIIGGVLGLTGAGGSVFAVPLLIYLIHLSPQQAIGMSLGAVGISALFGVLTRVRTGQIQWLPAAVYAVIGSLFTPLGLYINTLVSPVILMLCFSILVVMVAATLWRRASNDPSQARVVRSSRGKHIETNPPLCRANKGAPFMLKPRCITAVSASAVVTGILSGLFGVGAGFLIVPALLFLTDMNFQKAVATSLVVIASICLVGFASFVLANPSLDFTILGKVALGGVIGMSLGLVVGHFIAGARLQKLFALLMLAMAGLTALITLTN